jgi:O-antigen/teichoic acid export membrane protein
MTRRDNNNRIVKNTGYLYVRMILVMLVALYTSRVILEILGQSDFGIYNVVAGFVTMLAFFTSCLSNATQRFLSLELGRNNLHAARDAFSESMILYFLLGLAVILLGETAGLWFVNAKLTIPPDRIVAMNWVYQFSLFTVFISILQVPYISAIIAREKMSVYAYLGIFEVLAKLGIVFLLKCFMSSDHLILYGFLMMTVSLMVALFYAGYCMRHFPESMLKLIWDKLLIRQLFTFISYNAFGALGWAVGVQGINVVLNVFFGTLVNAARGVADQVNGAVLRFTDNIITAVRPQIIKSYSTGDRDYMCQLIEYSSKYNLLVTLFIILPIIFNVDFLLNVWLKNAPHYSGIFLQFMLVETLFTVLASPLWIAANATGKIRNQSVFARLFTLSTLPISYLLLKFGLVHSPVCVFAISLTMNIGFWLYSLWDIHRQLRLDLSSYCRHVLLPVATIAAFTTGILVLCDNIFIMGNIARFFVLSCISCISIIILLFLFGMSIEEKKLAKRVFNKVLGKKDETQSQT